MNRIALIAAFFIIPNSAAHQTFDATAKLLDEDTLEINIHHPSCDSAGHYVKHVTVKRGSETFLDQDFQSQTDHLSQDIKLSQTNVRRKRLTKGKKIMVNATCSQGHAIKKEVRVR